MSQKLRVLAALKRGPVRPEDFLLPNVCDGGKPIMRVGARVLELRQDGHDIATTQVNPTAVYTLVREAGSPPKSAGFAESFADLPEHASSPYADDEGVPWWEDVDESDFTTPRRAA